MEVVKMLIKAVTLKFTPSQSTDVVGYKLYYVPQGETLDYASPSIDLGLPDVNAEGKIEAQVSELPNFQAADDVFSLGITAVDDVGNESPMSTADVTLDFTAPDAPGPIEVVTN
jgi:hypothetical protein